MQILLRRAVGLACLVMAAYILVQVGQGLMAGHVNKLSKHHQEVIVRACSLSVFGLPLVLEPRSRHLNRYGCEKND